MSSPHEVTSVSGCAHALRQSGLRQALYDAASLMMDTAIVNLHGDEHRARRTVETKVFRKDFFHYYEKTVLPGTLAETLAPFLTAGHGDLVDIGYRIMMNLTADFTGIDRRARTAEETSEMLRLLRVFSLAPALGQSKLDDVEPLKAQIRQGMADFDAAFFTPSADRRLALIAQVNAGLASEDDLPRDVLTVLLQAQDELGMSRAELLKETIFYSLAGAHTSIHSLAHAMHEIFNWVQTHPEERARLASDPFFIQRCVQESIRLHPSSPVAKRRAICPVALEGDAAVATGEVVVVNLWSANRQRDMFGEDADRFNPHREIPRGQNPYGLSMGLGMHACLGRNLAVGVQPRSDSDPAAHQYGTVPLIVEALLRRGALPDPAHLPRKDETSTRITWASYPIIFRPGQALIPA